MEVDIDQLRALMKAMNKFKMDHLELHKEEESIVLRRNEGQVVATAMPTMMPPPPAAPAAPAAPAEKKEAAAVPEGELITSPFVGTFYRAPNPNADAFIEAGASFSKGQALCIVEAMKLMNEIEAEFDGECLEVLVENGKPVEYGDPLFRVKKG